MKLQSSGALCIATAALWFMGVGLSTAEELEVAGLKVHVVGPSLAPPPHQQPDWGNVQLGARVLHGLSFQESDSEMTFSFDTTTTHRFRTGGDSLWFDAALPDLPAGALITGLELEACDNSATQHAKVILVRRSSPMGGNALIGSVNTGDAETPGCALFGDPMNLVGVGETVENEAESFYVRAELTATDNSTSLGAVRVFYRLQVSGSPAVATFNDVPTSHSFFRYVEALAAAGITGGCGGGNYCPDSPVTRGQMAVFLSISLGLAFPY